MTDKFIITKATPVRLLKKKLTKEQQKELDENYGHFEMTPKQRQDRKAEALTYKQELQEREANRPMSSDEKISSLATMVEKLQGGTDLNATDLDKLSKIKGNK